MVAIGKITAIRVQDIATGIWYNWDNGSWSTLPICTPGAGNLYVAFWIVNVGDTYDWIDLYLRKGGPGTGEELIAKRVWLNPGAGGGVEWTGDMPTSELNLTCETYP